MSTRRLHIGLILLAFTALLGLFQNMSWVDIRDIAPRKPAGYLEDPNSAYLPRDMTGRSLEQVGQGILSHNFDPWFHQFETKYLRTETPFFGMSLMHAEDIKNGEVASLSTAGDPSRTDWGRWRVAMVTAQKMRITLQKKWADQDYEVTWEAQVGEEGIRCALRRPVSSTMNVGFTLHTGSRQGNLDMNYSF